MYFLGKNGVGIVIKKIDCSQFPYFFVRSFRYTASYRQGYFDFQMYRGGERRGLYLWGGRGDKNRGAVITSLQLCLVPIRRFPSPSQSIRFGDVSEVNGQETPRQKQNAHACITF